MRHVLAASVLLATTRLGAQSTVVADPAARLDTIFHYFASAASPGCAVGVSQRGQPITERAYGMADLEHDVPNTPGTVFEAGSVTKQITAGAVVLLALDGKLAIDDDVRKYLPELPDYGTVITIRHLLNHTSGLRDWGSIASLGGWPRGTRAYTNDLVLDIARHQRSLNYTPGAYYSYTNTGYNLLALLVGRVSGVPLAEFTRTRIFAPLGMTQTSWRDDFTRIVKHRAMAYDPAATSGWVQDMPFENAHGNGGLLTTPADLLRWTANLEDGATTGGPRFVEMMHEQARLTSGRTIPYAKGLVVSTYRGVPEVSHSGATAGYRAYLSRFPAQGVAVAVLCNAANANATALAHQVADAYLGRALAERTTPARATPAAVAAPPTPAELAALAALAGVYRGTRDGAPLRLVARDGALRTTTGAPLVPAGEMRFRLGPAVLELEASARSHAARLLTVDGDTVRYEQAAPFAPTTAQLAAYAGTYTSDEADGTLVVSVEPAGLTVRDRYGRVVAPAAELTPLYADAFGSEGQGIRFVRDARGQVTALSVREGRAWDVRFAKRAP